MPSHMMRGVAPTIGSVGALGDEAGRLAGDAAVSGASLRVRRTGDTGQQRAQQEGRPDCGRYASRELLSVDLRHTRMRDRSIGPDACAVKRKDSAALTWQQAAPFSAFPIAEAALFAASEAARARDAVARA